MTAEQAKFSWFIPVLGVLTALGPLSNELYSPSLPLVATGLDANSGAVQLTLSTLLLGLALGGLVYGPLSDQYGRRHVLTVGLAIYVFAGAMAALAQSLAMLVLWRFLQGLGASSGSVLARAIVLDRWRGEQASRVLSWLAIVSFLTAVLSPLVGGQIASFGHWPTAFWVHAAVGAACLAVTLAAVRSTERDPASRVLQRIAAYSVILRDREAVGYMACTALGFVGVAPLITNSSWVFQDYYGLTAVQYGLCFSLMMLGGSVGAYANSRIVARVGISKLIEREVNWGRIYKSVPGHRGRRPARAALDAARRRRARDPGARRAVHVRRGLHVRERARAHDEPLPERDGRGLGRVRRQSVSDRRVRGCGLELAGDAVAASVGAHDGRRRNRVRLAVVGLAEKNVRVSADARRPLK